MDAANRRRGRRQADEDRRAERTQAQLFFPSFGVEIQWKFRAVKDGASAKCGIWKFEEIFLL